MILFLNTLGPRAVALLIEDGRVVARTEWDSSLREYESLPPALDALCTQASVRLADLAGIACVNGPGSFTGMRTVVLTVNAVARVHGMPLMPLDFDALGDLLGWDWPRLQRVNRHECALHAAPNTDIVILPNAEIPA